MDYEVKCSWCGGHLIDAGTVQKLRSALDESVKLQSHYAVLLNLMDGGKRLDFRNGEEWIERLRHLKCIVNPSANLVPRETNPTKG